VASKSHPSARVANTAVIVLAIASAILGAAGRATGQSSASPAGVQGGPSIKETGHVAETRVADPGVKIKDAHALKPASELAIDKAAPAEHPAAPEIPGRIDQVVLARQIRSRFAALDECPSEVARHQHLARASAASGRFTLRWTILRTGLVADTAVVANSPVNPRVMDCVKRQMNTWSFTPPEGGTVHLERPFRFKAR
jgi:hypothetical protein